MHPSYSSLVFHPRYWRTNSQVWSHLIAHWRLHSDSVNICISLSVLLKNRTQRSTPRQSFPIWNHDCGNFWRPWIYLLGDKWNQTSVYTMKHSQFRLRTFQEINNSHSIGRKKVNLIVSTSFSPAQGDICYRYRQNISKNLIKVSSLFGHIVFRLWITKMFHRPFRTGIFLNDLLGNHQCLPQILSVLPMKDNGWADVWCPSTVNFSTQRKFQWDFRPFIRLTCTAFL